MAKLGPQPPATYAVTPRTPRLVCTMREITNTGRLHPSYFLTLPINPEQYALEFGRTLEEVGIINHRDIPRMGNRKLARLNFTALLPGSYDPSLCNYFPIPKAADAAGRLIRWSQGSGGYALNALRVTIAGLYSDTMVITDVRMLTEAATERGDVKVEVTLVSWVELKARTWTYARPSRPNRLGTGPRTYVVKSGDTLWGIARKHYGAGSEWKRIWDANKPMRSGNPNLIYVGERIMLPGR